MSATVAGESPRDIKERSKKLFSVTESKTEKQYITSFIESNRVKINKKCIRNLLSLLLLNETKPVQSLINKSHQVRLTADKLK